MSEEKQIVLTLEEISFLQAAKHVNMSLPTTVKGRDMVHKLQLLNLVKVSDSRTHNMSVLKITSRGVNLLKDMDINSKTVKVSTEEFDHKLTSKMTNKLEDMLTLLEIGLLHKQEISVKDIPYYTKLEKLELVHMSGIPARHSEDTHNIDYRSIRLTDKGKSVIKKWAKEVHMEPLIKDVYEIGDKKC